MLSDFISIARHIQQQLPELGWIDRDRGQLQDPERFNTLLTPAVLLDFSEVEWTGRTRGSQAGAGTLTVQLVTLLPSSTHYTPTSPVHLYDSAVLLADQLHKTLANHASVGDRTSIKDEFTELYYVISQAYELRLYYEEPIRTMPKPYPDISATLNLPIL